MENHKVGRFSGTQCMMPTQLNLTQLVANNAWSVHRSLASQC